MQTLKRIFFEDPTSVYVLLGLVEIVLLVLWYKRRARRYAVRLLVPLAAAAIVFVVEWAVVTLHEKLLATMAELQRDAETLDVDAVAGYLADDMTVVLTGRRFDKPAAVALARTAAKRFGIHGVEFINYRIQMQQRLATVVLNTQVIADTGDLGQQRPFIAWELRWRYGPQGWRIYRVEQPQVGLLLPVR